MRKPRITVGIDPGQRRAGLALLVDGGYRSSFTVEVWRPEQTMAQLAMMMDGAYPHDKARWEVWYECPQNGTHKSRGGVQFGAGLLTGMLQSFWALHGGIRRGKAHGVFPGPHKRAGSWRGYVLGDRKPPEDWKKWAIREVRERFGVVPRSDDEAEAILIAWYGSNQRL